MKLLQKITSFYLSIARFIGRNMEKSVDIEAKASFQPFSKTKKIDIRYHKGYRPTKKDKFSQNH